MAYVQAAKGSSASANPLTTSAINTTSGNFLALVVSADSGPKTVSSITDTYSNTWTAATGNPKAANGQFNVYVFYAANITGGASHVVTANFNGAALSAMVVVELSGRDTTSPIDFQDVVLETVASTSHASPSTGTLSNSGDDILCLMGDNAQTQAAANETYTMTSSGWVLPSDANVNTGATTATAFIAYRENVDTSSQQATWTNSAGNLKAASWILAVKAAAVTTYDPITACFPIGYYET